MTFSLDEALIDEHEDICNFLIDGFPGKVCTLIYQTKDVECSNCYLDIDTGTSTSIYKTGGPIPFENYTVCPFCGGNGRLHREESENIRLRVYYNPRQFIKREEFKGIILDADTIQIFGYMTDLPKIERAKELVVDKQVEGYKEYRFQPYSAPLPHGFRHQRYFVQMWRKTI